MSEQAEIYRRAGETDTARFVRGVQSAGLVLPEAAQRIVELESELSIVRAQLDAALAEIEAITRKMREMTGGRP